MTNTAMERQQYDMQDLKAFYSSSIKNLAR